MCGIIGQYSRDSSESSLEQMVRAGIERMKHRGPNDQGFNIFQIGSGLFAIGHTRLSIIDLTDAGHQPMFSEDGRYSIVFNGEIYNYKEIRNELRAKGINFYTNSDTEVLLKAWIYWGREALARFNGMFSFAIYDKNTGMLSLIRDAFGIKPLYFRKTDKKFSFASELCALSALTNQPEKIDFNQAYKYLVWGWYEDDDSTFYDGIKTLKPGHTLSINLNNFREFTINRWWWGDISERKIINYSSAQDELRELFLKNIRLNLRADVDWACTLSGGVDSSSIVCAIRHLDKDIPIHCFSYVAPGEAEDESEWIKQVCDKTGAISHKVLIDPFDIVSDMDDLILTQSEPFNSSRIYAHYRLMKTIGEEGIKISIDGQGADELLAGYHGYPSARLRSLLELGNFSEAYNFLIQWSKWPDRKIQDVILRCIADYCPRNLLGLGRKIVGNPSKPDWLNIDMLQSRGVHIAPPGITITESKNNTRRLPEALRSALSVRGLQSLLRHGDRNSMRWSLESRVPFLSTEMADFVLKLPENYLLSNSGETKHLFKAAMRGIVPDSILDRRDKVGFATPERSILLSNKSKVREWIFESNDDGIINKNKAWKKIIQILENQEKYDYLAWRIINFSRWSTLCTG